MPQRLLGDQSWAQENALWLDTSCKLLIWRRAPTIWQNLGFAKILEGQEEVVVAVVAVVLVTRVTVPVIVIVIALAIVIEIVIRTLVIVISNSNSSTNCNSSSDSNRKMNGNGKSYTGSTSNDISKS